MKKTDDQETIRNGQSQKRDCDGKRQGRARQDEEPLWHLVLL